MNNSAKEPQPRRDEGLKGWDKGLLLLMVLAGVLGLIYNGVILLGYGPDEPRHVNYVKLLLDEHRLPLILSTQPWTEYAGAHAQHPPLYYLLLTPVYALGRLLPDGAGWHLMRGVNLLMCLAALPLIYQIARRAGSDVVMARLVVAQVALLPLFGMTAGTVNNDAALFLGVTIFLWLLGVRFAEDRGFKSALVIGAALGLASLCKGTALGCGGVALLVYFLAQDGLKALTSPRAWSRLGLALATAALIAGPWYARNIALYGTFQPIPPGASPADMGWLPGPQNGALVMMMHPHFPGLLGQALWGIFYSLWSQKDWIPEAIRPKVYVILAGYSLIAVAGAARRWWLTRQPSLPTATQAEREESAAMRPALWCSYAAFATCWLACLHIALFVHWGQAEGGRYLLPGMTGFSLLLARGWQTWLGSRRLSVLTGAWVVALLALNAVTVYWLLFYLNPTYGPKG